MEIRAKFRGSSCLWVEGSHLFHAKMVDIFAKVEKLPSGPALLKSFHRKVEPITIVEGESCSASYADRCLKMKFYGNRLLTMGQREDGAYAVEASPDELNFIHELCHFHIEDECEEFRQFTNEADHEFDTADERAAITGFEGEVRFYENLFRKELGLAPRINHKGILLPRKGVLTPEDQILLHAIHQKDKRLFYEELQKGPPPSALFIEVLLENEATEHLAMLYEAGINLPEELASKILEATERYKTLDDVD